MKKILSMITLVAVFSSANVMADACSDAVVKLNTPFKMSKLTSFCRNYDEGNFAVLSAAAKGYKFVQNGSIGETARTCHTSCSYGGVTIPAKSIVLNSRSSNNTAPGCSGSITVGMEYAMVHELWHAASGPSSGEAGAITNTNKIRKGEGKPQRAGGTCF